MFLIVKKSTDMILAFATSAEYLDGEFISCINSNGDVCKYLKDTSKIVQVDTIPDDIEPGKFLYVDESFIQNQNWKPRHQSELKPILGEKGNGPKHK